MMVFPPPRSSKILPTFPPIQIHPISLYLLLENRHLKTNDKIKYNKPKNI